MRYQRVGALVVRAHAGEGQEAVAPARAGEPEGQLLLVAVAAKEFVDVATVRRAEPGVYAGDRGPSVARVRGAGDSVVSASRWATARSTPPSRGPQAVLKPGIGRAAGVGLGQAEHERAPRIPTCSSSASSVSVRNSPTDRPRRRCRAPPPRAAAPCYRAVWPCRPRSKRTRERFHFWGIDLRKTGR